MTEPGPLTALCGVGGSLPLYSCLYSVSWMLPDHRPCLFALSLGCCCYTVSSGFVKDPTHLLGFIWPQAYCRLLDVYPQGAFHQKLESLQEGRGLL